MKNKPRDDRDEDTAELIEWRSMSQEDVDQCWKALVRGACRGSSLEWRRVRKNRKYRIRKWRADCWAGIFALFREYNLQRLQRMREDSTEGEEMTRQQRMKVMKDVTKIVISKGLEK